MWYDFGMTISEWSRSRLEKTPRMRFVFFLVADILLIAFSVWFSFFLRFDGSIPHQYYPTIQQVILLLLFFLLPIFYFLKLYSLSWSYVSTNELILLVKGTVLGFLFLGAALYISKDFPSFSGFPRSTLVISFVLVLLLAGGVRFAKRIYLHLVQGTTTGEREKTLIVGAGDAGEQIVRSIRGPGNSRYLPIGFVDDDPAKQGITIHGLKVLGSVRDIPRRVAEHHITELIIALPSAGPKSIKKAVELGRSAGLQGIKIVPSMAEIVSGEISLRDLRDIQIEDLLARDMVSRETTIIKDFVFRKKILITGAAGSIGSELSRQIAKFNPSSLLLLDQDESGIFTLLGGLQKHFPKVQLKPVIADIQDKEKIRQIFSSFKPDIVFHAAAYKHVPLMEDNPDEAVKNNVFGTRIIAEACLEQGVEKLIFISTDKSVNPTSIMGATKRVGEMICQAFNQRNHTKFVSVRFGNVLDSRGSVIPIFREQIKKGGPVEVTHPDMKRYFMVISEAVLLVMEAGALGKGGEVFVLDMGKPIKIVDLAKEMIRLSGFEPDRDIPIVFTGPRRGEKFFEEMLTAEEGIMKTKHQNIFMANLSPADSSQVQVCLEELQRAIEHRSRQEIIYAFKKLIPSYKSYDSL